ncbi:hypothetical protein V8F20_002913 [Naviculisporaceae sp. PSN 640]
MGRWSHFDTDEERLPDGMKRVGYDADTQVYTYRDTDGSYWEGAPGVQYGKLFRVRSHRDEAPALPSITIPHIDGDEPGPHILPTHIHRHRRALEREKKQEKEQQSAIKRAGTISRIARYLSRGAGGSKKDNESIGGLRGGHSTPFSSTATGFSAMKWRGWPGRGRRISEESSGNEEVKIEKEEVEGIPRTNPSHRRHASGGFGGAGGGPQTIKPRARAMTFDEILASDGRLRGVITA